VGPLFYILVQVPQEKNPRPSNCQGFLKNLKFS
jgi:hypothetical protein